MMRVVFVAAAALLLSACGGGGGGGGNSAPPPVPPPNGTHAIQSASVQRAVANQALAIPSAAGAAFTFGGLTGADVARHVLGTARQVASRRRAGASRSASPQGLRRVAGVTYSACSNGVESASNTISQTEVQAYERVFYDNACTKLYQDIFLDVVATSQTAASASGTDTYYTSGGVVYDYTTLALAITLTSSTSGTISVQATDAPSPTAAQTAAVGVACNLATGTVGCGVGGVVHEAAASQDLGTTMSFNATQGAVSGGTVPVSVNGSGSSYTGGLQALSLSAGQFPNWVIGGGSTVDTATFSGTLTFTTSGNLVAMAITLTDAADDGTVTLSAGGNPVTVNGTVKQTDTGTTLATFTTDAAGNGTITYSNGTTATISNWNVLG
ncbi:MAG: hypothetical protein JO036_12355 [Candidatus Eremiobacteraeota bacterium]|nr:hypothetical protein [Candidatus Eremiobacteraeota bacterium]